MNEPANKQAEVLPLGQPFDGKGKVFAPIGTVADDGTFYPFGEYPDEGGMLTIVYACVGYTPPPDPPSEPVWHGDIPVPADQAVPQ